MEGSSVVVAAVPAGISRNFCCHRMGDPTGKESRIAFQTPGVGNSAPGGIWSAALNQTFQFEWE